MKHKLQDRIIFHIAKNRKLFPLRLAHRMASKLIKGIENCSYDTGLNGEERVLQRLSDAGLKVFFDVGANRGDWSRLVRRHFPAGALHCFEIAPAMHETLDRALKDLSPPAQTNHFGLSDHSGTVKLNFCTEDDGLSTLLAPSVNARFVEVEVPIATGDSYVEKHAIRRIDLLKLDVEGAENLVLKGFAGTLAKGAIRIIQFEYSRANIMSGFLLRDFHRLLEPLGYSIGKIFPEGVDFRSYSPEHENFIGPNFLAVHRDERDWISRLS